MTVAFNRVDKPFAVTDFTEPATLLLGLVENLEEVRFSGDGHAYSLTTAQASRTLGYDVKDLGRSRSTLSSFVDRQRD